MSFFRPIEGDDENNCAFTVVISETISIRNDYHRLRLLENAVINYGRGRRELDTRERKTALRIRETDAGAAAVLSDVAAYLRDVAIVGCLEEYDRVGLRPCREECFS